MPGPDKEFDGDPIGVRLTWEQRQHLEALQEDWDQDSLSEVIRTILNNRIRNEGKDPTSPPDQLDLFG